MASVPDGAAPPRVRACGPSTADLQTLADGCRDRGLQTGARASPGVYGRPLCEALAARGLHGGLLRAQASPRVPGRQRAVLACQWRQTLHRSGGLAASFRPAADCVARRPRFRPRAPLLPPRAPPGLHMHQALLQRHLPLAQALREVPGDPGPRSLRAIVAGERHPPPLAALRPSRGQQAADESALALTGPWRAAPLFGHPPALAPHGTSHTPTARTRPQATPGRISSGLRAWTSGRGTASAMPSRRPSGPRAGPTCASGRRPHRAAPGWAWPPSRRSLVAKCARAAPCSIVTMLPTPAAWRPTRSCALTARGARSSGGCTGGLALPRRSSPRRTKWLAPPSTCSKTGGHIPIAVPRRITTTPANARCTPYRRQPPSSAPRSLPRNRSAVSEHARVRCCAWANL
jgi:hypothetical protein